MPITVPFILILLLLATAWAHLLPGWTRPDVFFAVTVVPAFRESAPAHHILRVYRMILWSGAAATMIVVLATGMGALALVQIAAFFVSLVLAHHQSLAYAAPPATVVEVDLAAPPETLPGGPVVALLPTISLAALAIWASNHWDQLPRRIPVHIGWHGPDRWIARTPASVYGFIAAQTAVSLSMILLAWGVLHWSRRNSIRGPAAARDRRFRRLNVEILVLVAYFPAAGAWIALLKPDVSGILAGATLLLVAIGLVRVTRAMRSPVTAPVGDGTPDACWKMGVFYFNPSDPSIFVAKRFGIGYTVNFGNRWSWTLLGAVILIALCAKEYLR